LHPRAARKAARRSNHCLTWCSGEVGFFDDSLRLFRLNTMTLATLFRYDFV
jgi:hypothetical protein